MVRLERDWDEAANYKPRNATCKRCDKKYIRTSKFQRICPECLDESKRRGEQKREEIVRNRR